MMLGGAVKVIEADADDKHGGHALGSHPTGPPPHVALLLQDALTLDELQQEPGDLLVILRRNLLDQTDVMLQHLQLTTQLDDLADPRVSRVVIAHEKMACRDVVVVFALTTLAVMGLSGMGDLMDPSGLPLVG